MHPTVPAGPRSAAVFAAGLAWGLLPAPALSGVAVSRRRDGAELVRVGAGDPDVPGGMPGVVQRQPEELDPAAFPAERGATETA
jgi:hypothetical protein